MTIAEILELPQTQALKHINVLDAEYYRLTGRKVCRTCGGDVMFMLSYLKNLKVMSKFELKNPNAIYRMKKGSPERVSQSLLTDTLAIEYIARNKERIVLFKTFPENWEEIIDAGKAIIMEADDCCDEETAVPCDDCMRKDLNKIKMQDLKTQYPEVPAPFGTKKADFIEAIIQVKLAEYKNKK
jgi:hypothetical protein